MPRPVPTPVWHFTHVDHLPLISTYGLLSDSKAQQVGCIDQEIGNQGIKRQRRYREVSVAQGGHVADYVPFYFAPRSPMMYAIHKGNVDTYGGGIYDLVYLRTTVEQLVAVGLRPVFTDRNAALGICSFSADVADLDALVDWRLMRAKMWSNTEEDHDRRERRMAECLVHGTVPWSAISEIIVHSNRVANRIELVDNLVSRPSVSVRPTWYF